MEDAHDLEGLFQEPDDYPDGSRVWPFLSPEERLNLLLISWYLRTGLRRLFHLGCGAQRILIFWHVRTAVFRRRAFCPGRVGGHSV